MSAGKLITGRSIPTVLALRGSKVILPEYEELLIEQGDGILTITINRPQKRNAMNDAVVKGIMETFQLIADRRDIRAVVLRGSGGH